VSVYSNEYETQESRASVPLFLPFLAQIMAHAASASLVVESFAVTVWTLSSQVAARIGFYALAKAFTLIMPSYGQTSYLLLKSSL
jgi:hypothetical protein